MNIFICHEVDDMCSNDLRIFFNGLIFLLLAGCKQSPKPLADTEEVVVRTYPLTLACDTVDFTRQKAYSGKFSITANQEILMATLDSCKQCFQKALLIPCSNNLRTAIYQSYNKSFFELEFLSLIHI